MHQWTAESNLGMWGDAPTVTADEDETLIDACNQRMVDWHSINYTFWPCQGY